MWLSVVMMAIVALVLHEGQPTLSYAAWGCFAILFVLALTQS